MKNLRSDRRLGFAKLIKLCESAFVQKVEYEPAPGATKLGLAIRGPEYRLAVLTRDPRSGWLGDQRFQWHIGHPVDAV